MWLEPEEIEAGVRERRFSAETARRLLEHRNQCLAAARRDFAAHSNAQALQQAHDALDRGHPASYGDEFSKMFPPSSPLGAPVDDDDTGTGHYTPRKTSLIFPGEGQGQRNRPSVTWDGYVSGSAYDDDGGDEYDLLYGGR